MQSANRAPIRRHLYAGLLAALLCGLGSAAAAAASSTPAPTPSRAPLGAPPSNDATRAYSFRTSIGSDSECQQFAQDSDNVFLSNSLSIEEKTKQLEQIKARAKAAGCLK